MTCEYLLQLVIYGMAGYFLGKMIAMATSR